MARYRTREFLGEPLHEGYHVKLMSLLAMTTNLIGKSKRKLTSVDQIWEITDKAFGLSPSADESFAESVRRIRLAILEIPSSKRTEMRNRAFPEMYKRSVERALRDPNRRQNGSFVQGSSRPYVSNAPRGLAPSRRAG